MQPRPSATVVLAAVVLLAGVAPAVGAFAVPASDTESTVSDIATAPETPPAAASPVANLSPMPTQYKVTLTNVTINRWLLRNSTVRNVRIGTLTVRNVSTAGESQQNVTLHNVSVRRFYIQQGRMMNVTAQSLVVRNKSVLNIPGADIINPNVKNRVIKSHTTRNKTVAGVVIDRVVVASADLRGNATIGQRANSSVDPTPNGGAKPAISVKNGSVDLFVIKQGEAANWTVAATDGVNATTGSSNSSATSNSSAD